MGLINAGPIARNAGLGDTFNTAMLGAYVHLTGLIQMKPLMEAVRIMVPSKIEANLQAVKEAYEQVKIFEVEG